MKKKFLIGFSLILIIVAGVLAFQATSSNYEVWNKADVGGTANANSASYVQRFILGNQPVSQYSSDSYSGRLGVLEVTILSYINLTSPSNNGEIIRGNNSAFEDASGKVEDTLDITSFLYVNDTGVGIPNLNCSFYFNNTLIGSAVTNSTGYCVFNYDKSDEVALLHSLKVNYTTLDYDIVVSNSSEINISLTAYALPRAVANTRLLGGGGTGYFVGDAAIMRFNVTKTNTSGTFFYDPQNLTVNVTTQIITNILDSQTYPGTLVRLATGQYYSQFIPSVSQDMRWDIYASDDDEITYLASTTHADREVDPSTANLNVSVLNSSSDKQFISNLTLYDRSDYLLNSTNVSEGEEFTRVAAQNDTYDLKVSSENLTVNIYDLNVTNTISIVRIQHVDGPAIPVSTGVRFLGDVIAINASTFDFGITEIIINKKGLNLNKICYCANWDFDSINCDSWSCQDKSAYDFSENNTDLFFNVTSFSAYAGGVNLNANLTISDDTDSVVRRITESITFYADYFNETTGGDISSAECNISFDYSGTWSTPVNLSYVTTNFQYSTTFAIAGTYNFNVSCSATNYDLVEAVDSFVVTVAEDGDDGGGGGGGGGGCLDECSPSGTLSEFCSSETSVGRKLCGNYDDDSCLEWSEIFLEQCPGDCFAGVCVGICTDGCILGEEETDCADINIKRTRTCDLGVDGCSDWGIWHSDDCAGEQFCSGGVCGDCIESWNCDEWTECVEGNVTRTCGDLNSCGTQISKPSELESCEVCLEDWECSWTECGEEDEFAYPYNCVDSNLCGTNNDEPSNPVLCEFRDQVVDEVVDEDCTVNWECDEWANCNANYNFEDIFSGDESVEGFQNRECVDLNDCKFDKTELKLCSLFIPIGTRSAEWCEEDYVEIFDKDTDDLVSRIKEEEIVGFEDLNRIDISFAISEFTGYCDYCFDGVKNYDEEEIDCGGPSCADCFAKYTWFNWVRIVIIVSWSLFFIFLFIIYREEEEKKKKRKINFKRKLKELFRKIKSGTAGERRIETRINNWFRKLFKKKNN